MAVPGALLAFFVTAAAGVLFRFIWLSRWSARKTLGNVYFGLPEAERRALKLEMARRGRQLLPIARVLLRVRRPRKLLRIEYEGVRGPAVACTRDTFARAARYVPEGGDVFVATQMKCGTTWMQQLVYEVLCRGEGDLGDAGHRHLYALSPWIEARQSVSLEEAPRIGESRRRIVKTHMPTRLCPYSPEARYVYVARHPVACFASCVDFVRMLSGPFSPTLPNLLDWFCSDEMWWRSWPEHVDGWWRWSEERGNVLFVHYEEMLEDLPGVVDRVSVFLEAPLTESERGAVVRKSGFEWMKAHEELFEMAPPTLFSGAGSFLRSGSRDRERDVGRVERERILAFCRERLAHARYPAARFYPDLQPVALPAGGPPQAPIGARSEA